jgi:surface protein
MMGNNPEMADAFITTGATCYTGFTESNSIGPWTNWMMCEFLLNGLSIYGAYNTLPEDYYKETVELPENSGKFVYPELILWPENKARTSICITHPETLPAEISSNEGGAIIKLKGRFKVWDPEIHANAGNVGILYSKSQDMNDYVIVDAKLTPQKDKHLLNIDAILNEGVLEPNTTYYYCAYMIDGYSNCYGEIKSFTTTGDAEAYWVYNDVDSVTTYYYDDKIESRNGIELKYRQNPSAKIVFDSSFANFFPNKFSFRGMSELREIENIYYLNTDSLTSMNGMFGYCTLLKQLDLSQFHTDNVTDMSYMFDGCISLLDLDLSSFNTSKVTDMNHMFNYCSSLKKIDLSSFDTSNVTDMSWMFHYCPSLDSLNLKSFNTYNVTDMHRMFYDCYSLENLDISTFNTKKVVDMAGMFSSCRSLKTLDISSFDTSSLIDMSGSRMDEGDGAGNYDGMFAGCKSLKAMDLSNFDTSKVTDMHQLFQGCTNLRELNLRNFVLINNWNRDCSIFFDCDSLYSIDLSEGKIVGCGEGLFRGLGNLRELILYNVDTSNVDDMSGMFDGCRSLEELNLSSFDTSKVMDMWGMFNNCTLLRDLDISNFIISDNVISKNENGYCFNGLFGTSHLASSLENIILNNAYIKGEGGASLFAGLTALKNLELNNVDTSESTNMDRMFAWCSSLQDVNLNSFNTNDVSNMREMFSGCTSLKNLNLGTFNTSKVNDMSMMFAGCDSLRSLDLSNFNTFNVANMREMFLSKSLENLNIKNFVFNNANWPFGSHGGCPSLVSIDLSNGKAIGKGAEGLFFSLSSLKKVNLDNFDTSEAVNLSCMFCGCSSLTILDLSSFNVSKVNDVTGIFSGCHSLTKIYAGNWYNDINNDYPNHGGFSGDTLIFTDCKNLVGGQGTKVGENYFKGDDGETGIYHCYGSVWDAHIDGGKENPGLFTAK